MESTTPISPALHRSLLAAFLDPSQTIPEVAEAHSLDLSALLAWSADPEVAAELDALEALAQRRLRALAAQHIPAAVETLAKLLTSPAPETARRAASALLRLLGKGPHAALVAAASRPTPPRDHTVEPSPKPEAVIAAPPFPLGGVGNSPGSATPSSSPPPALSPPRGSPPVATPPGPRAASSPRPDRSPHRLLAAAGAAPSLAPC